MFMCVCVCACVHEFMCACVFVYMLFTQLYYSLGCHYFWHDDFKHAHSHFKQSTRLLASLPACPSLVDSAKLKGFVGACKMIQGRLQNQVNTELMAEEEEENEEEEEEEEEKTLLERLEHCRVGEPEVLTVVQSHVFVTIFKHHNIYSVTSSDLNSVS